MRKVCRKNIKVAVILLLIITVVILYFRNIVSQTMVEISASNVQAYSTTLANSSVYQTFSYAEFVYEDFFTIYEDSNGEILTMQTNTVSINLIMAELVNSVQLQLKNYESAYVEMPLGSFFNFKLIYSLGPKIKISISPIGSSYCDFVSNFESSGINQTRHQIYANLYIDVLLAIPSLNKQVQTCTQVLLVDNIIVGDVPETYLNGSIFATSI